ncbi:helicase sen1-like [Pollicipes pollicipes]|uniref:helicase sen1-like n=1 Tax=Pollicipes pollicipes TaxID=41117 RepID=UPI00188533E2|nr:helicase sen1-like [Pollicipes pollicipes]
MSYKSHADYVGTFQPLLLHELWSNVSQDHQQRTTADQEAMIKINKQTSVKIRPGTRCLLQLRCEALISARRDATHPELGALVVVDLPQRTQQGVPARRAFVQAFAYVEHLKRQALGSAQLRQRLEQFAGVLRDGLSAEQRLGQYAIASCTLLLRHREGLAEGHWDLPVKMSSVSYIRSDLRLFSSVRQLGESPLLHALLDPVRWQDVYRLPELPTGLPAGTEHAALNATQRDIVLRVARAVTDRPDRPSISVIRGPPGTGKTRLVVSLVKQILFSAGAEQDRRVLLCAPSNAAVDEVAKRLLEERAVLTRRTPGSPNVPEIRVVRFGRRSQIADAVARISLDELVDANVKQLLKKQVPQSASCSHEMAQMKMRIRTIEEKLQKLKPGDGDEHELRTALRDLVEQRRGLQQPAAVTAVTRMYRLTSAGSRRPSPFTCCIVDEAGQCTEPDVLIPLEYGIKKRCWSATGPAAAHRRVRDGATVWLARPLLKRLYQLFLASKETSPVVMLTDQYRMQPDICRWPARYFYGDRLRSLYLVLDVCGARETSHANGGDLVVKLSEIALRVAKSRAPSIGIITPYRKQRQLLLDKLKQRALSVDVQTVDGFQGQERDIVVLSCVRSNGAGSLGFLDDRRRLNVALTRARCCLYVCGHLGTLKADQVWSHLIQDARERRMVVTVPNEAICDQFLESRLCSDTSGSVVN